jgi:uncharacterized protein YjeT (DUF2065 family)
MYWVIRAIGLVFVLVGVLYFLKPAGPKWLLGFFKKGNRLYIVGLLRLMLAVVFLLAARECKIPWVIMTFGILFIVSGLIIFVAGPKRIGPILQWFQEQSIVMFRILSVIAFAIGVIIIFSA